MSTTVVIEFEVRQRIGGPPYVLVKAPDAEMEMTVRAANKFLSPLRIALKAEEKEGIHA